MQNSFRELLRLLSIAEHGWMCGCSTTARAYLRMAEAATFKLLDHATKVTDRDKLLTACNYSTEFCSKQKNYGDVIRFMPEFWSGVGDGFFKDSFNKFGTEHYKIGYRLGLNGS